MTKKQRCPECGLKIIPANVSADPVTPLMTINTTVVHIGTSFRLGLYCPVAFLSPLVGLPLAISIALLASNSVVCCVGFCANSDVASPGRIAYSKCSSVVLK